MTDGIVNLKGKQYYTVARRVHDFRAACSITDGWALVSSLVSIDSEVVIMRGAVVDPQGREVAVGFAEERRSNRGVNSTSALENCETSALGRALAAAGYGGSGQYASADELANALHQQGQQRAKPRPTWVEIPGTPKSDVRQGQRAKPKPSWSEGERRQFLKHLADMGVSVEECRSYLAARDWGSPADWSPEIRGSFIADLASGKMPELYKPASE